MAAHILLKNYTAPRIATTNMCAKFRDDLIPLSRPARFHAKANKKKTKKKYKKKYKTTTTLFPICCQIEGFTRFARSSKKCIVVKL